MKVWTEADMNQIINRLESETEYFVRYGTNRTPFILHDIRAMISAGARNLDDLTICGYSIGDLVPLAETLWKKGIKRAEILSIVNEKEGEKK